MKPLVIAHRGASGTELENTLAAFRQAAAQGADGVELDVHVTADGELVVHHDEDIDGAPIADMSARSLAIHRLVNGEPIPTLAQALAVIPAPLAVFVEVKGLPRRWDARLLEVLDANPRGGGYAIHSFDHGLVRRLVERRPALTGGVLLPARSTDPLAVLGEARATDLWPDRTTLDEALVRRVHAGGGRVIAWTVDDPSEMARLAEWGVDGICTNYPERARRVVDARAA